MDEARHVLDRLDRIEALGRRRAEPEALLGELRELVREAEAWARREGRPAAAAADAIETLKAAVQERGPPAGVADAVSRAVRRPCNERRAPSED